MSERDAFLRWCHPDLLVERLRHAAACWQVLQALDLDPSGVAAPEAGSQSLIQVPSGLLGISSMLLAHSLPQPGRARLFGLEPSRAPLWVLALLQEEQGRPLDPLDSAQWQFWVVPAHQFHPERRSIALQPLIRAHGEGMDYELLPAALAATLRA